MASRRRSNTAKAHGSRATHLTVNDSLLSSNGHTHHESDDGYQTVSNVLSFYGIDGSELAGSFRQNKTEFAAAVVDRFYKRDRKRGLLAGCESVELVDLRLLKTPINDEKTSYSGTLFTEVDTGDTGELWNRDAEPDKICFEDDAPTTLGDAGQVINIFNDEEGECGMPQNVVEDTSRHSLDSIGTDPVRDCIAYNYEADDQLLYETRYLQPRDLELSAPSKLTTTDTSDTDCVTDDITSEETTCIRGSPIDAEENELDIFQHMPDGGDNQGPTYSVSETKSIQNEDLSSTSPETKKKIDDVGDRESCPVQSPTAAAEEQGTIPHFDTLASCSTNRNVMEADNDNLVNNVGSDALDETVKVDAGVDEVPPDCNSVAMVIRKVKQGQHVAVKAKGDEEFEEVDTIGSTEPTSRIPRVGSISAASTDYEDIAISSKSDEVVKEEVEMMNHVGSMDEVILDVSCEEGSDTTTTTTHPNEAVPIEGGVSSRLGCYHSIKSESAESVIYHDAESSRPSDGEVIISMISSLENFKQNIHRVSSLLCSVDVQQLEEAKTMIDAHMRTASEDAEVDTAHLAFVLLVFLEMSHRDPMKLPTFVKLATRVTSKIASPEIHQEAADIYRLLLESVGQIMVGELSFEVARTLMDSFVGLAFRVQNESHPLFSQLCIVLTNTANRCNAVDEYRCVVNMMTSRIGAGESHTRLITTLMLRLFELMLSSASMDNPFHEARNAVQQVVDVAMTSNFDFLKALVDCLIKSQREIASHFIMLFIARLMMGYYHRDEKMSVLHKRRCLRLLQTIAVPVFTVLNDVEKACGFIPQYVSSFPAATGAIFKLTVFDLSLLDGCGKMDAPVVGGRQPFDEGALREAAQRYMTHLECNALHDGRLCDLVLLLSFKHVARFSGSDWKGSSKTHGKRKLERQGSNQEDPWSERLVRCDDPNKKSRNGTVYMTSIGRGGNGNCSTGTSSRGSSTRSVVPRLTLKDAGYMSDASSDCSGKDGNPVNGKHSEFFNEDNSERSISNGCQGNNDDGAFLKTTGHVDDYTQIDMMLNVDNDLHEDRVVRYARIVCRLFAATRGKRADEDRLPLVMAPYLLMPSHKLSHVEDACDAETCFKLILYHVYSEIFLSIWRTMTNALYSTNEYSQLSSASTFLYTVVVQRFEYLQYRVVKKLVVACMGDQCYMVRLTAVKLLAELFKRPTSFEGCINDELMNKLMLSMRDVNWKVRLAATTAVFHYIRRSGVDLNVMPAIAAVAERACDIEKEQQAVRDVVLSILAFSLFSTRHPFLTLVGNMDARTVALIDRFVKVILYKMSAFKARDNQVERVLQYFRQHFVEVEGKEESSFLQSLSKLDLKEVVENHTKVALEKWMNLLLDLFLLRRSEGASFHVLAEVLCVLKLFGQVNPELFASHMTYFLPYLRVDPDDTFDASRIDVMVLVCNLVAISSAHSKDLQQIDHHVLQLVSFDAPALTRAAIQLLVELELFNHVASICEEAFDYLSKLRFAIEKERRNSPAAIVNVMSYNVLLRSAWNLGCVAEFAELNLVFADRPNWPQQLFDLILAMADIFYSAKLYNVAGMLVQSIARMFINICNVVRIDFKGVKSIVKMFGDQPMVMCVMMLLYQLLATYAKLGTPSEFYVAVAPLEKIRFAHNEVFCCLGSFVEAFVHLVSMDDMSRAVVPCADMDLVMTLEICNMIFVNRLTNPEPVVSFVFCHVVSQDPNVQRLAEQALKTLARNDPDILLARLGSCLQTLLLAVIVDSFAVSIGVTPQPGTPCSSSSSLRKGEPHQEVNGTETNSYRRSIGSTPNRSLTDVSNGINMVAAHPPGGGGFIFGYESEFTAARVRGIVRLFLEAITSSKHSKKLMSVVIGQLSACMARDFRQALTAALERRSIQVEELRNIRSINNSRLAKLLMKHIGRARNGDSEGLVDYFTLLFVDMLTTVLDHLTFRNAKIARFLLKRANQIMKSGDEVAAEAVLKYRDSRLASLSSKIKQFYT